MDYTFTVRAKNRIEDYLNKNVSKIHSLEQDIDELYTHIGHKEFFNKLEQLIDKHQIKSLFKYQDKIRGFFLKLSDFYDKTRKITIISQLNIMIKSRKDDLLESNNKIQSNIIDKSIDIGNKYNSIIIKDAIKSFKNKKVSINEFFELIDEDINRTNEIYERTKKILNNKLFNKNQTKKSCEDYIHMHKSEYRELVKFSDFLNNNIKSYMDNKILINKLEYYSNHIEMENYAE